MYIKMSEGPPLVVEIVWYGAETVLLRCSGRPWPKLNLEGSGVAVSVFFYLCLLVVGTGHDRKVPFAFLQPLATLV